MISAGRRGCQRAAGARRPSPGHPGSRFKGSRHLV